MNKEIHIWMSESYDYHKYHVLTYYYSTFVKLIDLEDSQENFRIDTTQTFVCSTKNLVNGIKIFVHMLDGEEVEIKLGTSNKNTDRSIKVEHNLEKLLLSNEFGQAVIYY